jgi:diguanylate cyclase (GGDEF)-like protein
VTEVGVPAALWVAAVHTGETDEAPLGAAVVLDEGRLLTCAHVVTRFGEASSSLWVAFPMADDPYERLQVRDVRVSTRWLGGQRTADVAVLDLLGPLPAGVEPAALRCPKPADVVAKPWWAFGFPDRDPRGNVADGLIGSQLGYGWVRLDSASRYNIQHGFSGAGLWSPDYGAVVAVIGQANDRGDGQAITLHQVDICLPQEKLRALAEWTLPAAGEEAVAAWGWTLATDVEAGRHWRPRSRGVTVDSERGYRFRGRTMALTQIIAWLDRPAPDRKALVVTGSPGVGKSAVLGRVVTTADAGVAAALPADDTSVRARPGAVACAVHAKGKTALDIAREIARAASATLPERPEDVTPALAEALAEAGVRSSAGLAPRFNVIIDALDEASSPSEAQAVIDRVVLPIAETCARAGAQVVVGTRRGVADVDLLGRFGATAEVIDLDDPRYFALEDLAQYALATLQLRGDERPDSPYSTIEIALPVAERIAQIAEPNFLIAGLIARAHGLHDHQAATPADITITPTVDAALRAYLERIPATGGRPAEELLTVLAFADSPGWTADLWVAAVSALTGCRPAAEQLRRFARGPAASFLIESTPGGDDPSFRLFHQALADTLRSNRARVAPQATDEQALTRAFLAVGRTVGWGQAPAYLLRSLSSHAIRAGIVDEVLGDDDYLLHADLQRLIPAADQAITPGGRERSRLLHLTPAAVSAKYRERAALFNVTQTLEGHRSAMRTVPESPYRALWASTRHRAERAVLEGHTQWVNAVCEVSAGGRTLLASGGDDGTVRVWDPVTGAERARLEGHTGGVRSVCVVDVGGHVLLASGGDDGTVRVRDPVTGAERARLEGHTHWVNTVCGVSAGGRTLLASGGDDGTVRVWDPVTGVEQARLEGHTGAVLGVCTVEVDGATLLVSAGADRTVRIWDLAAGCQRTQCEGHMRWVSAVCAVPLDGRTLLASAGNDGTIRVWDPSTGSGRALPEGHRSWVRALCAVRVSGRTALASTGDDGTVRVWDPITGAELARLKGHTGWAFAVCAVSVGGQSLLASAGADRTLRVWDPAATDERVRHEGHLGGVHTVCAVTVGEQILVASAGYDGTVRLWDAVTGAELRRLVGHTGWVRVLCAVSVGGQTLLASAGSDGTVRLWDPVTGAELRRLEGQTNWVASVCAVQVAGQTLLALGGDDRAVRLWDPVAGTERMRLAGHRGVVVSVCAVQVGGQTLLASAGGRDGTVRVWDPVTGAECRRLEGHTNWVWAVCSVRVGARTLLASAGEDRTVRLWDPETGAEYRRLEGHTRLVASVCTVNVGGQTLLASASHDRTVRLWDPATGRVRRLIPVHHDARLVTPAGADRLAIALAAGVLVLAIRPDGLPQPHLSCPSPLQEVLASSSGHSVAEVTDHPPIPEDSRAAGEHAIRDELTGLPNQPGLRAHVRAAMHRASRCGSTVAVLWLDLDDFKAVNDSLGHLAGDEFLIRVGERLVSTLRGSGTVARIGGDEFVVVCEEFSDPAEADCLAERIQLTLTEEILLRGKPVSAPASIGVAVSSAGSTWENLLREANEVMYFAKQCGGRCWSRAGSTHDTAHDLRRSPRI